MEYNAKSHLRKLDYTHRLETVEEFRNDIEILSSKKVINLITSSNPGSLICITGPRGIGKSTFVGNICYCWAQGLTLHKYKLIIWIDLATSLGTVINDYKTLLSAALSSLQNIEGMTDYENLNNNIIVVLDNYTNKWKSVLSQMLMRRITVVVTSYEFVNANEYVHVLGLSDKQIARLVMQYYVKNDLKCQHFLQYLSSTPNFNFLKRIPMYLHGLLYVFDNIPKPHLPRTLMMFLVDLALLMNNGNNEWSTNLDSINSLPSDSLTSLQLLGQAMYDRNPNFRSVVPVKNVEDCVLYSANSHFCRQVSIALPLRSDKWCLVTPYTLLNDFIVSVYVCNTQQLELILQMFQTFKNLKYFILKLAPQVCMHLNQDLLVEHVMALTSYDYENKVFSGINLEDFSFCGYDHTERDVFYIATCCKQVELIEYNITPLSYFRLLCGTVDHTKSLHKLISLTTRVQCIR